MQLCDRWIARKKEIRERCYLCALTSRRWNGGWWVVVREEKGSVSGAERRPTSVSCLPEEDASFQQQSVSRVFLVLIAGRRENQNRRFPAF